MSESEYKKLRAHLRILTITVVLFIALAIASLVHTFVSPKTSSFPKVQVVNGKNGKDSVAPKVDYGKINQFIQAQIAQLPVPQNGINGTNGQSIQGPSGASIQGPAGTDGGIGPPGLPASISPPVELQYNATKSELEWRYAGDFTWQVLLQTCQITNTCGVQ